MKPAVIMDNLFISLFDVKYEITALSDLSAATINKSLKDISIFTVLWLMFYVFIISDSFTTVDEMRKK